MKGTDLIIQSILNQGVDHIFMVPGGLIDPFYLSICEAKDLTALVAAHEAGAAYMADGYARASGLFGVCFVIGGPGVTNTTTAVAAAFTDRSPILLISGEVPTNWEGRGGFQDASSAGLDDISILKPIVLFSEEVENKSLLMEKFHRAHRKMMGIRKGPVHLSIPTDVQNADYSEDPCDKSNHDFRLVDEEKIELLWEKILPSKDDPEGAKNIVILVGGGVESSEAATDLIAFAEKYQIPVATTLRGKGIFPEDHPLSLGVFGYSGTQQAIETILSGNLDLLIVLGSSLNQRDTLFWDKKMRSCKILAHVNEDPAEIGETFYVDVPIVSDCREVLRSLLSANAERRNFLNSSIAQRSKWVQTIRELPRLYDVQNMTCNKVPLHPAQVVYELRKAMPRNTVLVVDSGAHRAFCGHYWEAYSPRHYLSATNLGPMGWAIPAGIGAKVARPELPCVVVTGDGCMQMHGMEIQTAARYGIAVIFVIINNGALGNVYLRAKKMGEGPADLTEIPLHDWAQFACSLGAEGLKVEKPEQLPKAFETALKSGKPFVLDIRCGRDYPTPVTPYAVAKKEWLDNE